MARLLSVVVLGLCAAACAPAAPARADERVVVRFADSASRGERAAARRDAGVDDPQALAPLDGVQVVQAPDGEAARAAAALGRADGVVWAQPDRRVRAALDVPGPDTGSSAFFQWGLFTGLFPTAWDTTTGDGSPIAVVDTGVDFSIGDLDANHATYGHDWVDGDGDPSPPASSNSATSHGTHVAGIAAASLNVTDPASDVAGAAPGATIMALRALDTDGSGWTSDIAAAFAWAAEHGVRVVNASLSGVGESDVIAEAIASHRDTLFVVAAGNGANHVGYDEDARPAGQRDYPCAYPAPNVLCVAAVGVTGARAGFSNYGATSVDIAAPGVNVLSYVRGGVLEDWDGTSMATPYAAAAAALAFAKDPHASPTQVRTAMLASAWARPSLQGRTVSGGMVDAAALLTTLDGEPAPAVADAVALAPGRPAAGQALTAAGGRFDRGTVDWSWERCNASASACAPVIDDWSTTYTATADDVGMRLRVTATATSSGGSTASSALSEPVVAVPPVATAPGASVSTPAPATAAPAAPATPTIRSPLSARWSVKGARLRLLRLVVSKLPRGASVRVTCRGAGCPLRALIPGEASHGAIDLRKALGRHTTFRAGQTLEVVVTAAGYNGEALRFALKRGRRPVAVRLCVPAGTSQRRTSC